MPINPFPDSLEKQVIRIRDGFDIKDFRSRKFNGTRLKYFGMPSAELLDIITWEENINVLTAVERDIDILKDIRKSIFKHKIENVSNLLHGDICEILMSVDIGEHQIFNLDFYGGFVHKREDGSASVPQALKALIRRQAEFRTSFMLIMTFNLRDDDKVEYDDYIETLNRNLSKYPVKNLEKNIKFHILKGDQSNVYKLKICLPCFVYFSGLPDFKFDLKRIYHYKTFIHFVLEMIFVSGKALGELPDLEMMVKILNMQISEVRGRLVIVKEPKIPEVVFAK